MTSLAERIFSIIRSPWALVLLAIAVVVLLVLRLNAGRAELAELRREKAEGELRSAGLLVLERRRARELEDRVTGLSVELQAGHQFADILNVTKKPANMKVAMNVRGEDFAELFLQRMESLSRSFPD